MDLFLLQKNRVGLSACLLWTATAAWAQTAAPSGQTVAPPKPASVTTTVVVHGEAKDDYLPDTLTAGTLSGLDVKSAPLAAKVVTRELMTDQMARLLSDVTKSDASIGDDYVPVGYYGVFMIRGFAIDLATGIQINGLTVSGEQNVPLENQQSVEFVKGLAGVESGVASAGGLIGFVTKRPALVHAVDAATDHRGTAYGAADLGHFFGSRKQVGARLNVAGEHIESYLNGADGWRGVGAGALDWKPNAQSALMTDFEYQHKVQRSQSGYQLLGGTVLPDLDRINRSTMLGLQSWTKPNTFDAYTASARYNYQLPQAWRVQIAGSFSHSLIDDNVAYSYGCTGSALCSDLGGTAPDYFFAPDGTYDLFDYRNPGELYIDAVGEALLNGHVKTGIATHDVSVGGELFLRSVRMPGAPAADAPDWVQNGSVYAWIGTENIYEPLTAYNGATDSNGVRLQAGPRALKVDSHQSALLLEDRIHLPGHVQLLVAGRYDSLRNHNFSGGRMTDKKIWLPQYAVTYNPVENLTLYANYGVMLSLGQQAPWWVKNSSVYLDPYNTRQAEIGAKYAPGERILITAALFRMHAPYFYPKLLASADSVCSTAVAGNLCFESDGREHHQGIELNAEGKAARWLRLTASATAMKAESVETSTPSYNGKQVVNQPHLRTSVFADLLVPRVRGLHLMPGWNYTGRKEALRDNSVSVTSYNIFNLGARYTPGGDAGKVSFRLFADNLANKRYWKDTGSSGGDSFLYEGAPTTVRLSVHYTF